MLKNSVKLWLYILFISLSFYFLTVQSSYTQESCYPYPSVKEDGQLIKDCKPFKAIGVNYFDAFYRVLKNYEDESFIEGFKKLSESQIPFTRVMASGFWPKDWELYLKDREKYFSLLDKVVKTAEKYNVGLVLSLFWHYSTVPDIVGEPVSKWGDNESETIKFMKKYTAEVVTRYKDSPAVWVWEFGNEYNLKVDLPDWEKHLPKIVPSLGTPPRRTERDILSSPDMINAFIEFAKTVRSIDKIRPISSGNSLPRPGAYHNSHYRTWDKDTSSQFASIIKRDNPDPVNLISIHLYPGHEDKYFADYKTDLHGLVKFVQKSSGKKPVFIGEFGVCSHHVRNKNEEKEFFKKILDAIVKLEIPLSAVWVYDFKAQDRTCNVTFENHRAYQLIMIKEINIRFSKN